MTRILTLAFLSTAAQPALAATLHVGPNAAYTTVQSAVDAASTGDVIRIQEGSYTEQILVDDSAIEQLSLIGAPGDIVTLIAPSTATTVIDAVDVDLLVRNLTVDTGSAADTGVSVATTSTARELRLCDVDLQGPQTTGSIGLYCDPDPVDSLSIRSYALAISGFDDDAGSLCPAISDGWDVEDISACQW